MLPFAKIQGGTILATASTPQDIQISSMNPPDYFVMRNITQWGAANSAKDIEFYWERSMAQATARGTHQTSSSTPAMQSFTLTSDGISTYSTASPPTFAALASTAVNHTTWVVSMSNTGTIAVGDTVRLYNVAGMQEISGHTFTVTAVSANVSITLGYMATAQTAGVTGITVDGTTGFVQKVIPSLYYPKLKRIAGITQAAAGSAKIYFMQPNDFTPGERIGIRIPSLYGMTQLNNVEARVLSVVNTATESSVVIDIDTSGMTAFTYPTSAQAAAGVGVPIAVPSASAVVPYNGSLTIAQQPPGTNLLDSFDNRNIYVVHLGATIFANSSTNDVWLWQAYKYDEYNNV